MEKGKTMDEFNIKCSQNKRVLFYILAFLITFIIVQFHSFSVSALDTQNIIFSEDHRENVIAYVSDKVPSLSITMKTGVTSFNMIVYDRNGNVLEPSFFQGKLPVDEALYPIKIVCSPQEYESNWSVRCSVTYQDVDKALEEYLSRMDRMTELLKNLKDKMSEMQGLLNSMNDFLSNPKYLEDGLQDLEDSVMALTNANPVVDAGNTSNMFKGGLTGTAGGTVGDAMFDYMGIKVNLLNFSAIEGSLATIRNLLKAIIWIEFAVFCLKIVVPKFKV